MNPNIRHHWKMKFWGVCVVCVCVLLLFYDTNLRQTSKHRSPSYLDFPVLCVSVTHMQSQDKGRE